MACLPKRLIEFVLLGTVERLLHAVCLAQCGRLPERVDSGAARDEEPGDVPKAVADSVIDRTAAGDRSTRRLDIGTGVDQRRGYLDIVRAGRPMQRRLRATPAVHPGI
jgi:hypothetical protein